MQTAKYEVSISGSRVEIRRQGSSLIAFRDFANQKQAVRGLTALRKQMMLADENQWTFAEIDHAIFWWCHGERFRGDKPAPAADQYMSLQMRNDPSIVTHRISSVSNADGQFPAKAVGVTGNWRNSDAALYAEQDEALEKKTRFRLFATAIIAIAALLAAGWVIAQQ